MAKMIEGLCYAFQKNLDYGPRLVADLSDSQMVAQPQLSEGLPVNHPAWIFSHLNIYLPVMEAIIKNESFDDPRDHEFGMLSTPVADASIYPSRDQLLDQFVSGHQSVLQLLHGGDDALLENPVQLPRWKELMPTAAIALPYLMLNHENLHLGQISAWRRVQGMPSV